MLNLSESLLDEIAMSKMKGLMKQGAEVPAANKLNRYGLYDMEDLRPKQVSFRRLAASVETPMLMLNTLSFVLLTRMTCSRTTSGF